MIMAWRGLTVESKDFCSYDKKSLKGKIYWWFEYIFNAAPKFWWYTVIDKLNVFIHKIRDIGE